MKKKLIIVLALLLVLCGCHKEEKQTDGQRFKQEYEALNGQKDADGKSYSTIEIKEDSPVHYVELEKIAELLENGTHVIYMGWPECPYCRRAVPVLMDTVSEYEGMSVYYCSMKDARQAYKDGLDNESAKLYKQIADICKNSAFDFTTVTDTLEDGTLNLVASMMIFVQQGEIIGCHKRTVDSQIDPYEPLSETQVEKLKDIYKAYLEDMAYNKQPACSGC